MAIAEVFTGSAAISTTEYDLPTATTTVSTQTAAGIYQLFLDLSAMTATEEYRLRIYEKTRPISTQRIIDEVIISGVQTQPVYVTSALVLKNGWTFTLKKNQGTDRTIEWSIRQVA